MGQKFLINLPISPIRSFPSLPSLIRLSSKLRRHRTHQQAGCRCCRRACARRNRYLPPCSRRPQRTSLSVCHASANSRAKAKIRPCGDPYLVRGGAAEVNPPAVAPMTRRQDVAGLRPRLHAASPLVEISRPVEVTRAAYWPTAAAELHPPATTRHDTTRCSCGLACTPPAEIRPPTTARCSCDLACTPPAEIPPSWRRQGPPAASPVTARLSSSSVGSSDLHPVLLHVLFSAVASPVLRPPPCGGSYSFLPYASAPSSSPRWSPAQQRRASPPRMELNTEKASLGPTSHESLCSACCWVFGESTFSLTPLSYVAPL
jgi:hypothetical protein